MTQSEFIATNWQCGNIVRLSNGKDYLVKTTKCHGRYILCYSSEYDSHFIADYRIVECRISDHEAPAKTSAPAPKKRVRQRIPIARKSEKVIIK